MLIHKPLGFKHSGDRGDLIYSLPAMRYLGGGTLYLDPNPPGRAILEDGSLSLFNYAKIESIIPLMKEQEYVLDVKFWSGEAVEYDFDRFRSRFNLMHYNLSDAHLELFNIPVSERNRAWLRVKKPIKLDYEIIVARSPRYQNWRINWRALYPFIEGRAAFVGHPIEHARFQDACGSLPYVQTNNMLELAQVIAGCNLFIGNQSSPYAMAEGMKKNCILEVCPYVPNCLFNRPNCFHLHNSVDFADLARWEDTLPI